jgi:hypothetical protein
MMKKWLMVIGVVFAAEVLAEAAHLASKYVFVSEVSRTSIVAFVALFLSAAVMVFKEA